MRRVRPSIPRVIVAILTLALVLMGLEATLICFGRDGHVAAEATTLDHHLAPHTKSPAAIKILLAEEAAHGPCVDAAFFPVVNDLSNARVLDLAVDSISSLGRLVPPQRAAAARYDESSGPPSDVAARSTVLRL